MDPISKRIHRLCMLLFSDIQLREAARQIGVANPLLSRTLSGARGPSKTLIEKLAAYPGVNPRWLLHGIGDPLIEGGLSLPVIKRLPKKPETKWEELEQEAERFWVAEARFSESRYWWQVTPQTLRSWGRWAAKCKAAAGDYLLLETDRKQIEAMSMKKRLVIASHPELNNGKPQWGVLGENMKFLPFSTGTSVKKDSPIHERGKKPRRRIRRIAAPDIPAVDSPSSPTSPKQLQQHTRMEATVFPIDITQVLAVVIEMTSTSVMAT